MAIVPNLVLGEDGKYKTRELTTEEMEDQLCLQHTDHRYAQAIAGTPNQRAIHYWIEKSSYLKENHSYAEVKTFAMEWTREDAIRNRTRLIYGKEMADITPTVLEILELSFVVFDEHKHPLAGTPFFEIYERSLGGLISILVGMGDVKGIKALAFAVETLSQRDYTDTKDKFWTTHAGRMMLIWNAELLKDRLISKQELWDRFQKSGFTIKRNKFYGILKKIGLNGLPGSIRED